MEFFFLLYVCNLEPANVSLICGLGLEIFIVEPNAVCYSAVCQDAVTDRQQQPLYCVGEATAMNIETAT
jgi:hypothetical protein